MNSNSLPIRIARLLSAPLALIYSLVVRLRNNLYDNGHARSASFDFPVICVGNLSVGGTGKSPMVEYLLRLLSGKYKMATLSRGYKRRTKGYILAGERTTALDIGDEPMQFHMNFPSVAVCVGEDRIEAVPFLLNDRPDTELLILDDAFQHRAIAAGLNILLTDYHHLYTKDFILPLGNLRDNRSSAKRAQIIVVTKCPADLSQDTREKIVREIAPGSSQKVFFTTLAYGTPYSFGNKEEERILQKDDSILLVTGIAKPQPLLQYIASQSGSVLLQKYGDHHAFTSQDISRIRNAYLNIESSYKYILTTEKDAVRLLPYRQQLEDIPVYVIPVKHQFLFNEEQLFNDCIEQFAQGFRENRNTERHNNKTD